MNRTKRRERQRTSAKRRLQEHRLGGVSSFLRLPPGVEMFQPKAGRYRLDFLSFRAGKGNPYAKPGEPYFERTYWVHRDVGPNHEWHLCLAKTLKVPCPVCEHRAELACNPDADEEQIRVLAPKERQLWLVLDLSEQNPRPRVWDVSHYLFGKMMDQKIQNADEEDGYDFFADPVEGQTVRIALTQSEHGKWLECADIEFKTRKTPYDEVSVGENPCLDDMLVATPYDQLRALFLMVSDGDSVVGQGKLSSETEQSGKERKASDVGVLEGSRVVYGSHGVCEVVRISGDGTSLTLMSKEEELIRAVGVDEVELVPPDEKFGTKSGAKVGPKKKKEEPVDDWDDDDWDSGPKKTADGDVKSSDDMLDDWD